MPSKKEKHLQELIEKAGLSFDDLGSCDCTCCTDLENGKFKFYDVGAEAIIPYEQAVEILEKIKPGKDAWENFWDAAPKDACLCTECGEDDCPGCEY
jgi:hypothetical protein